MSLDDLTEIGLYLVVILYFFLPVFVICFRGRIIWAGIALFVIQFLPVGWQIGFTDLGGARGCLFVVRHVSLLHGGLPHGCSGTDRPAPSAQDSGLS